MNVLEVNDLVKGYPDPEGGFHLIVDIPRFQLAERAQVALQGRSGSGKTTLLHLLAGILTPDRGSVTIAGTNLTNLSEAARDRVRARHVGYIFQTFNLLQGYTALENVELAMDFGLGRDPGRATDLLNTVGLGHRLTFRPSQLSTGQQQRVAVARALANRPALVLADEPTGNLDPGHARDALDLIRNGCRENGAALLLVSHDRDVIGQFDEVRHLDEINRAARTACGSRARA